MSNEMRNVRSERDRDMGCVPGAGAEGRGSCMKQT